MSKQIHPTQSAFAQFLQGAKDSQVIIFTYLPVSFAFGVSATQFGFTATEALFLSCTMYAGASQFLVVALLASGSSIWMAALTVIALDIRHVLYGPALHNLIQDRLNLKKTALWSWGLTDEVFASGMIKLTQRREQWSESWMLGLSLFSWLSWSMGSLLGGLFANQMQYLPAFIQAALDFLLPALFLSFLLAAFEKKHSLVVMVTLVSSAMACYWINLSAAIFIGIISGICAGIFKHYMLQPQQPPRESV
ncbi:4-azaleucine resistance transporter AzlC [Acinetobacter calcoaceticus]|uniref:4-azaleucine resistance transporter AzlC n=1 Tax=Acinetobacter calcoaceticus TaxID=471 RepID=A0A4R1XCI8_ACICA|nr:4-azaleucine resistance transporter AzlC [Acinetobacter calcoaceticus]